MHQTMLIAVLKPVPCNMQLQQAFTQHVPGVMPTPSWIKMMFISKHVIARKSIMQCYQSDSLSDLT